MFQNVKQLVLKVTRGCNLRCNYCYLFNKDEHNDEEISDEVFDFIIRRWLSETTRANIGVNEQPLELIFHGGEPLRIGKQKFSRFVKKAFYYAKQYNKNFTIGLQTNTTLLDEEWYDLFLQYNISVGVSFDGIGQDTDLRSNKEKDIFIKLVEMKAYGVKAGPLLVLHKGNYKNLNHTFKMLQTVGYNDIKINRGVDLVNTENSEYELSADELMEAAETICEFMFTSKGNFKEGVLFNIMRKYLNAKKDRFHSLDSKKEDHCYSKYCGGMRNLMELEPDGTFQFCGRTSTRSSATVGGTVFDKDVLEIGVAHQQWEFQKGRLKTIDKHRCSECPAQYICDGGCLAFSHQKLGEARVDPTTCKYFKSLHKYFTQHEKEIMTLMIDSNEMNKDGEWINNNSCKDGKCS